MVKHGASSESNKNILCIFHYYIIEMKSSKIVRLELDNYKIFKHENMNLGQCNVFVGPNSSGKTSNYQIP